MSEQNAQCRTECPITMPIHTRKITDSCRDKDCIEDLRVYLTTGSQALLDTTANAKVRSAELICADVDVEPVAFDRNHYCIDVTFFYRILADAVVGTNRPAALYGLAVFSKRAVLCGEETSAHTFSSSARFAEGENIRLNTANLPTAVVEVLEPMVLGSRVREICACTCADAPCQIPAPIRGLFDEELVLSGDRRRLFVTLGQFSVIRLERDTQMMVEALSDCIPCKECCDTPGCAEDPCEMFSRIPFPTARFVPRACECPNKESGCTYQTT